MPHALNPLAFYPVNDPAARPIDIGSRGFRYPPHIGDDERNRVIDRFICLGQECSINVDISDRRLDRTGWARFLNQCKGTVSTEAGSWFLERDDVTVETIRRHAREDTRTVEIANDSKLFQIAHRFPRWVRRPAANLFRAAGGSFEYQRIVADSKKLSSNIPAKYFGDRPRPPFYGKCISSRHFDAVGTKTCQIMLRGRFNDILEADIHYLALDQDFGNLKEVMRRFLDAGERQSLVENAFRHVMTCHTYPHRMHQLQDLLSTKQRNASNGGASSAIK